MSRTNRLKQNGNHVSKFEQILFAFYDRVNVIRRAFQEFLAFPSVIILFFMLLAVVVYLFERSQLSFSSPINDFFRSRIFSDAKATSSLLGNIVSSIITVTSITITLLLLIVQQTANNMTSQVFDQFLRRRSNQFFFGYFVGVAVYTLITLATVREPFNPVLAASLVFLFTILAIFLLLVLFYSTIHQMRSAVILQAIHEHTLTARANQKKFINKTLRKPKSEAQFRSGVLSKQHGFVTGIRLDDLRDLIADKPQLEEIILTVSVGSFVAFQDRIAELLMTEEDGIENAVERVRGAITLERTRDLASDPAYGIQQLETIGWTALSPSKSNLVPGLQVIYNLRDLLKRWSYDAHEMDEDDPLPIVYNDDVVGTLLQAFESLAVVASLSREHQVITDIIVSLSSVLDQLPGAWKREAEESILRILPMLREFHITEKLERALKMMAEALRESDRFYAAEQVDKMLEQLKQRDQNWGEEQPQAQRTG